MVTGGQAPSAAADAPGQAAAGWPDRTLLHLFGIQVPVIQAPMAGCSTPALAAAVANAGGLGSLALAMQPPDRVRADLHAFRRMSSRPVNVNFFCHPAARSDAARDGAWRQQLEPYRLELGLAGQEPAQGAAGAAFSSAHCDVLEELTPEVVSFHFGLPSEELLTRLRATGAKVLSSATTVAEAVWLQQNGCDAVIAQGLEAGGHRGTFLPGTQATQVGTLALVPQVVDAVGVPVVAAGGIADGRGVAAAVVLGAAGVQVGTAYLSSPEATVSPLHRRALQRVHDDQTVVTNVFTGRPARAVVNRAVRELGPMAEEPPDFPLPIAALAFVRAAAEAAGADDFTPLWCGQAVRLGRALPAGELTTRLGLEAQERLQALQPRRDTL